jgi:hypothetical protein
VALRRSVRIADPPGFQKKKGIIPNAVWYDDPVKNLQERGKPLRHLSIEEIKRIIDKRAREEVGL